MSLSKVFQKQGMLISRFWSGPSPWNQKCIFAVNAWPFSTNGWHLCRGSEPPAPPPPTPKCTPPLVFQEAREGSRAIDTCRTERPCNWQYRQYEMSALLPISSSAARNIQFTLPDTVRRCAIHLFFFPDFMMELISAFMNLSYSCFGCRWCPFQLWRVGGGELPALWVQILFPNFAPWSKNCSTRWCLGNKEWWPPG